MAPPPAANSYGTQDEEPRRRRTHGSVQSQFSMKALCHFPTTTNLVLPKGADAPYGFEYLALINELADLSPRRYFYAGEQFRGLRAHVKQPLQSLLFLQPTQSSTGPHHLPSVSNAPTPERAFPFTVIRDYDRPFTAPSSDPKVDSPEDLINLRDLSDGSARIVFLRGFPAARWVTTIGQRFRPDTEFFRQHLRFLNITDYHSEPPWPSLTAGLLRLRVQTIINRRKPLTSLEVESMRRREFSGVREYLEGVAKTGKSGDSLLRRMCVLDEKTFLFEQEISITFAKPEKRQANREPQDNGGSPTPSTQPGWTSLVWLDTGQLLPFDQTAPWQQSVQGQALKADRGADCVPLLQRMPLKLHGKLKAIPAELAGDPTDTATHGAFYLPFSYGSTLNHESMKSDPFYGLSGIISFAINSQNQFLNRINHGINQTMEKANDPALWTLSDVDSSRDVLARALTDFNYSRRLLADTLVDLEDLRAFLAEHSIQKFTGYPLSEAGREARVEILQDLECAIRRVRSLINSTSEGANFIANEVMLIDSALNTSTARVARRLNLLLCSFVPASLVVGFFGVNVKEFDSGNVRIWVVIATFVPVTLIVLCSCFYLEVRNGLRELKRQLQDGVYPKLRQLRDHVSGYAW